MEMEKQEEEKKEMGAKDFSLFAQIVAAVWNAGWNAAKFGTMIARGQAAEISTTDIMIAGFSIVACFSPVFFSIIMDKIKGIKIGV